MVIFGHLVCLIVKQFGPIGSIYLAIQFWLYDPAYNKVDVRRFIDRTQLNCGRDPM